MNPKIEQYMRLKDVSNAQQAQDIMQNMMAVPQNQQKGMFVTDNVAGAFLVWEDPQNPGVVYECVMGLLTGDSISTLYEPHPMFNTRQAHLEARQALIEEIKVRLNVGDDAMPAIRDKERKRAVMLPEMATMQLIDMLNNMDKRISTLH